MAELGESFDPNSVEPSQYSFDNLPSGEYAAHIVESEVKPTKGGNGLGINLTWQITEGEFTDRKIFQWINFKHDSQQAQTIGQQQLKAICDAIGFTDHMTDSAQLHFQACRIRVGLGKPNNGHEAKNEIKAVKPYAATAPTGKPAPQQQPPAAQKSAPQSTAKPATAGRAPAAGPPTGNRPWANRATG